MMEAGVGFFAANNGHRADSPCCHGFCHNPMAARYPYACLFLLASLFACVVRESQEAFFQQERLSGCGGDRDCLQAEGVLRISMTSFIFYAFMSLTTMFAKNLEEDIRNIWHTQFWLLKCFVVFVLALVVSTFVPTSGVQLYGDIAPVGAGIFICIQQVSVIRYITRLNYEWCQTNFEQRSAEVIMVSFLAYNLCMVGSILMIIWYAHCLFNKIVIYTTLLLVCLMPVIALMTKQAKGRYLEPGLVGLYILYLCGSAVRSEPETGGHLKETAEKWKTVISFVFGLVSIAVAAFTTGSDYKSMQFGRIAVQAEDDTPPYGYGLFHSVFAVGSMYMGMVLVAWDTHHIVGKWKVDVGWLCTLVHLLNEALVVISFVAILLTRTREIDWLRQLLARIFGIGGQQQGGDQPQPMELEMGDQQQGGDQPQPMELEMGGQQQGGDQPQHEEIEMDIGPPPSPESETSDGA